MIHGLKRTSDRCERGTLSGWRLLLPTVPCWRRGYLISEDLFATGWWWWSVGVAVEPIGWGKAVHGLSLRLTWGWTTSARPEPYELHPVP